MADGRRRKISWWRWVLAVSLVAVALGGFWYPGVVVVRCFFDETLRRGGVSPMAVSLHRSLTPRYEAWARKRVVSGKAAKLNINDVSGTEWPLFGSAFYLWSTEFLQQSWEKTPTLFPEEPRLFARSAVEQTVRLVTDPNHADWVRKWWGEQYLERENVFYRMLLMSAITSGGNLTGSTENDTLLKTQAETLARDLDASPAGLLDDYPGQCYPTDVIAAIVAIRRSDARTHADHAAFVQRSIRGFEGLNVDKLGLPPYSSDARSGRPSESGRGCGLSFSVLRARELWPERATEWYASYEKHFWQSDAWTAGFREFSRESGGEDWYFDVDSGPVLRGIGFAASAFGVAAARAHGRYDHAYPLTLQMMALSWPLPNGRLLIPWSLSNATDAPLLGETAILFVLSQSGEPVVEGARWSIPGLVWICLAFYFGGGIVLLRIARRILRGRRKPVPAKESA